MGVDSGLPDFRGNQGFWKAYPALGRKGMGFYDAASPATFVRDPHLAWGFYGHRLALYRATEPHPGFALLRDWAQRLPRLVHGLFVFTSNVDGQFQKAGHDPARLVEVYGQAHPEEADGRSFYHDQWWISDAEAGVHWAYGIHGQAVLVHHPSRSVVARFSTWPSAIDAERNALSDAAALAVCEALGG